MMTQTKENNSQTLAADFFTNIPKFGKNELIEVKKLCLIFNLFFPSPFSVQRKIPLFCVAFLLEGVFAVVGKANVINVKIWSNSFFFLRNRHLP
jgi:hypothetical protein